MSITISRRGILAVFAAALVAKPTLAAARMLPSASWVTGPKGQNWAYFENLHGLNPKALSVGLYHGDPPRNRNELRAGMIAEQLLTGQWNGFDIVAEDVTFPVSVCDVTADAMVIFETSTLRAAFYFGSAFGLPVVTNGGSITAMWQRPKGVIWSV